MKVLVYKPNEQAFVQEINGELKEMSEIVGGYIEVVPIGNRYTMVCNEEGQIHGLPNNRLVGNQVIKGNFFVCKVDELGEEFEGLTESEIDEVLDKLI